MLKKLRQFCLIIFLLFGANNYLFAQYTSYEFWPEADIWYRLSPSTRLSLFIPVTKYNESKYRDLNVYLQADYAWGKSKHLFTRRLLDENRIQELKVWLLRGGFMEGWSLGENAGSYTEDMLFAEIHRRIPIKGRVLLSHRFRTDLRWVGEDPQFSYRLRYRMMIEMELKNFSIVPYVNVEPYWDSRYKSFNRIRMAGGATIPLTPRFAFEANITYQYDSNYDAPNMYALNFILHMFFETRRSKGQL